MLLHQDYCYLSSLKSATSRRSASLFSQSGRGKAAADESETFPTVVSIRMKSTVVLPID